MKQANNFNPKWIFINIWQTICITFIINNVKVKKNSTTRCRNTNIFFFLQILKYLNPSIKINKAHYVRLQDMTTWFNNTQLVNFCTRHSERLGIWYKDTHGKECSFYDSHMVWMKKKTACFWCGKKNLITFRQNICGEISDQSYYFYHLSNTKWDVSKVYLQEFQN